MWCPSVLFYPINFSHPLLHIPLSIRLAFLLGTLSGRATRDFIFLLDSLLPLVVMRLSCEAVPVLQLPLFRLFA